MQPAQPLANQPEGHDGGCAGREPDQELRSRNSDVCLHQGIGDYDCAGGSGNGPNYVEGPLRVLPPDPFDLDGYDNDGIGCESG